MKIGLVAACREQQDGPLPVEELFTSPLFRAAARYCRERYSRWFILSDRHVLLPPDAVLERHDEDSLSSFDAKKRSRWARQVLGCLSVWEYENNDLFLHAGQEHAETLLPVLNATWPFRDMDEGARIQWYERNV